MARGGCQARLVKTSMTTEQLQHAVKSIATRSVELPTHEQRPELDAAIRPMMFQSFVACKSQGWDFESYWAGINTGFCLGVLAREQVSAVEQLELLVGESQNET